MSPAVKFHGILVASHSSAFSTAGRKALCSIALLMLHVFIKVYVLLLLLQSLYDIAYF